MWKKMVLLTLILAAAGTVRAATVTDWDTANVALHPGPWTLYESYINTIFEPGGRSIPADGTGGITWKERDTQFPGMSIVTIDDADASNCIMSAGVNPEDGSVKQCSDPFQSSKRFKSLMYQNDGATTLIFQVETDDAAATYRVLQKLSNWTDVPVTDFIVELGFVLADGSWQASETGDGLGISTQDGKVYTTPVNADMSLQKDLAALFAHGLFGAPDKHHATAGYFDPERRATFDVVAEEDRIYSNGISGNHFDLFGDWNSAPIQIYGMYWDDDQLSYTDNILMANCNGTFNEVTQKCEGVWETYRSQEGTFVDTAGVTQPYPSDGVPKPVSADLLAAWAADEWMAPAPIDDFANINLNWHLTLGDTSGWPTPGAFAIRFIPNIGMAAPEVPSSPDVVVTKVDAPQSVR